MKFLKNDIPIKVPVTNLGKAMKTVIFADIPTITDFEIVLINNKKNKELGMLYYSPTFHVLTTFPFVKDLHKRLPQMDITDIPLGTLKSPYMDIDTKWSVLLYELKDHVYIFQSNEPGSDVYISYYRVPKWIYLSQWKKIMEEYNDLLYL